MWPNSAQGGDPSERFLIAYDFETFSKSATESGINVGDRALPVNLDLKISDDANVGREPTRLGLVFGTPEVYAYSKYP